MRRPSLLVLVLLALGALVAPLLAISSGAAAAAPGAPSAAAAPAAAARKAVVRSTITQTMTGFRGRLTSDRVGCVRGRDVYIIVGDGSGYPMPYYVATTDNAGRWETSDARLPRRGGTYYYTAFTLANGDCAIAQSRTISSTLMRGTAGRAPKAAVSITLEGTGPAQEDFDGRISSKRAACERFRPVFVFSRPAGSDEPFQTQLFSISRVNGVWKGGEDGSMRRGGDSYDVLVAVPGNGRCRPAQSQKKRLTV